MAKLTVITEPTPIRQSPAPNSPIVRIAQTGEKFVTAGEKGWVQVTKSPTQVTEGYVNLDANKHTLTPDDIFNSIKTDAEMYLRETESFQFSDGVLNPDGLYRYGYDYNMGDIVALYDHYFQRSIPVRVVEEVYVFRSGDQQTLIPSFEKFVERTADE